MAREARYRRTSGAIRDSRGYVRDLSVAPTTNRRLVERRVGNARNPYEGLADGARRVSNQIYNGASQISAGLGRIADGLMDISDTATREEIAKIEQENKELELIAKLDHVKGAEYNNDRPAYVFERKRLETMEEIQKANQEKALASLSSARSARRSGGGGGGGKKDNLDAMKEAVSRREAMAAVAQGPNAVAVASDTAKEITAKMLADQAIAQYDAEAEGYQTDGLNVADTYGKALETVSSVTEGMPDDVRVEAEKRVFKTLDASLRKDALKAHKERIDAFRENVVQSAQTSFLDGELDTPEALEATIGRATIAFNGDVQKATTKTLTALSDAAKMRIEQGNRASYYQYSRVVEPFAKNNPQLWEQSYAPVTQAFEQMVSKEAKADVDAVKNAIAQAKVAASDENATGWDKYVSGLQPAWEYMKSFKSWNHPEFQKAKQEMLTFVQEAAQENAARDELKKAVAGQAADIEKARKAAEPFMVDAYRKGNTAEIAILGNAVGELPGSIKDSITQGLRVSTAAGYYTEKDEQGNPTGGPGLLVDKAFKTLSALPENIVQDSLGPENYAYYDALRHMAQNDPQLGIEGAKKSIDEAIRQGGMEQIKRASKGEFDLRSMYPDLKRDEAEAELNSQIADIAYRATGGTLNMTAAMNTEVKKALAYRQVFSGGVSPSPVYLETVVRKQLETMVKAPSIGREVITGLRSTGVKHMEHELVQLHSNPAIARKGAKYWGENASELFNTSAQKLSKEAPFIVADDEDVPLSFTQAPARDAVEGYMKVVGSGSMTGRTGLPVVVAPGSKMNYQTIDRRQLGDPKVPGEFVFPAEREEFEKAIQVQNDMLQGTGFMWKIEREDPTNPVYYLGFRPPQNFAADVAEPAANDNEYVQAVEKNVEDSLALFQDKMRENVIPMTEELEAGDPQITNIVRDIVQQMSRKTNSPIPANLGLSIKIPEFKNAYEAMDWLEEAYRTELITGRAGRPYPTNDPAMTDEWNMLEVMKGRNGFSSRIMKDPEDNRRMIGAGVPLDSKWVKGRLREYGVTDQELNDIMEGRSMVKGNLAEAISVDAYKHGEKTLLDKGISVQPDLPWESYSTLVMMAVENPEYVTPNLVSALNKRDWRAAERLIRGTDKTPTKASERRRALDANTFIIGLGLSPAVPGSNR